MFRMNPFVKNFFSIPSKLCSKNFSTWNVSTHPNIYYPRRAVEVKPPPAPKAPKVTPQPVFEVKKGNLCQSPWKMNFLVKLIRGTWVPDALAQLKFTPKHRAVDLTKMVKRASSVARIFHEAIPEELAVKEVFVTKGAARKKVRMMGRGRTGVGYIRKSNVTIKLELINFPDRIAKAKTHSQKMKWIKIQELVAKKRLEGPSGSTTLQAKASEVAV